MSTSWKYKKVVEDKKSADTEAKAGKKTFKILPMKPVYTLLPSQNSMCFLQNCAKQDAGTTQL